MFKNVPTNFCKTLLFVNEQYDVNKTNIIEKFTKVYMHHSNDTELTVLGIHWSFLDLGKCKHSLELIIRRKQLAGEIALYL